MRRLPVVPVVVGFVLSVMATGASAEAQPVSGAGAPADLASQASAQGASRMTIDFMTAYRFHLALARFAPTETAFKWDARFGGDFNLVDFGKGYVNILVDLETVVGGERRLFDPNQVNYTLDGTAALRENANASVGFVFHHVSRHLVDRLKSGGIDWNVAGLRADAERELRRLRLDGHGMIGKVVGRSFVDYSWEAKASAGVEHDFGGRYTLRIGGDVDFMKTTPAIAGRSSFADRGFEMAVRLNGSAGGAELFLRGERRNDPGPLIFDHRSWVLLGFRFVNR